MLALSKLVPWPYRIAALIALVLAVWGHGNLTGRQAEQDKQHEQNRAAWQVVFEVFQARRRRVAEIDARAATREAELVAELGRINRERELLDDELSNRPQIVIEQPAPVAGECPVCVSVDWDCFACLHNLAKGTGPKCSDSCAGVTGGKPYTLLESVHNADGSPIEIRRRSTRDPE